ncbi:surface glycoprotein [Halobellus sp. H-GB7]|uniref:surface glycoprotein n=1 Tax=Halobellus sp. H-GB7 TaxID=3069756 RepID=UPI0027AE2A8C|nr:surface glycoprotein [Halobellus sp. H-GB7]MDQ2053189.1 surface glycoprotein [Halobellus sp. H-GB7]
MTRDLRNKARAVFLATLMVVSVFGGTMAFAGSAAAATNSASLSDTLVSGGEIQVNGSVDANGTVVAFVDDNGDGEYNTSSDAPDGGDAGIWATEYVSDHTQDSQFSIPLNVDGLESGTYDVYVFQVEGQDSYTISNGDTGERSAELQVDADEPVFGNETPEDGTTISAQQDIVVPITDANTSVDFITATVTSGEEEVTFELNPDSASADGVAFSNNELTITPGAGNVPALDTDGVYTVDVTAEDEVGNSNTTDFTFTIESADPTFSLDTPALGDDNVTDLYDDDRTDYGLATNYENQTIEVDIDSPSAVAINDSHSSLTVTVDGADYEESFDYTDTEYDNDTHTFTVVPGENDVQSLPATGDVTVDVSAEDDAGNTASDVFSFHVDTTPIQVTDLELSDSEINESDVDHGVDALVTFNDTVDENSVDLTTSIDGESNAVTGQADLVEGEGKQVAVPLNLDTYGNIENASAVMNVTAASDVAGNGLSNADADASNETFSIDTDGPSITLSEPGDISSPIQGYVNFTTYATNEDDIDEISYEIYVGTDASAAVPISELPFSAENVPTQNLPDGTHTLAVTVEDSAGNDRTKFVDFTLDNDQPLTVEQEYLPGLITPVSAGGYTADGTTDISPADVFSTNEGVDATYYVDGEEVAADHTITAEVHRGLTEPISAEVGGENTTVRVSFAPLVGAESVSGDEVNIGVETLDDVEHLDELNVTVEDTDGHFAQTERTLTREDFSEYEDSGIYTATVDGLDDGTYDVTVTDAEDDDGDTVNVRLDGDAGTTATVDDHDPMAETAYLIGSNGGESTVTVEFNEHVALEDESAVSFRDSTAAVKNVVDNGDGTLTVTLDGEVQTVDAPLLNVSDVTETNYGDTQDTSDTSTPVATAHFELSSDGLNVISIPAETGRVELSATGFNSDAIDTISAYDAADGTWEQYSPGAEENNLTYLEGGQGYVVDAAEDTTVEINAENAPPVDERNLQQLQSGWNLIGHYQEGKQSVGQVMAPLGDQFYQIEAGYDGSQLSTDASLDAGEGYWVFTTEGGPYVPVNYGGATSEKPTVGTLPGANLVSPVSTPLALDRAGPVGFPVNGEEELIFIAQVSDENQISTVQAHSEELGIDETLVPVPVGTEMYFERPPSEEFIHLPPEYSYTTEIRQYLKSIQSQTSGTLYVSQGTVEADYAAGYDGIENTSVTVSAVDAYGNVGQVSQEVDPADRTGSVEIVESDLKASDDDDAGQITVDTTYNTGGVADAQVIVKNAQTGQVVATDIGPIDGESHLDVNMTRVDNGDKLNAYLVDASEGDDYDYVVAEDTNDEDAQTVSGLTDLAYTVNDDGTIADSWDTTGDSTLQTAVDNVDTTKTLYLENGEYDSVGISRSVTITNASNADPVITDTNLPSSGRMFDVRSAGVSISGLTFDGNGNTNILVGVRTANADGGEKVVIKNNEFKNLQTAIQTGQNDVKHVVKGNNVTDAVVGVSTLTTAADVTVQNNDITVASDGEGIGVGGDGITTLSGNTITVSSQFTSADIDNGDNYASYSTPRGIGLYAGTPKSADGVSDEQKSMITIEPESGHKVVDMNSPAFESSGTDNVGTNSFDINVDADEDVTAYYVVETSDSDSPDKASVVDQSASGEVKGQFEVTADSSASTTVSGLSEGTAYDVYVVIEDDGGNTVMAGQIDVTTDSTSTTTSTSTSTTTSG